MTVEHWKAAWQQLIGPGSPYEVVTPGDGNPRYFRNAAPDLLTALNAGRAHGEREFVVWEEQRLTFAELFAQVDRLSAQLRGRFGVQKGDRVAIAMRNQPAWLVSFVAAVASGAKTLAVIKDTMATGPTARTRLLPSSAYSRSGRMLA